MKISTHLFLVHGDLIPNITPALDPGFRPEEVFLLSSPIMEEQTVWLEYILKQAGITVSRWPLEDPWDIEHVQERVLEFLATKENEAVALNVTCGTKPMSLAAFEAFQAMNRPVYYVHPERDYVVWLNPKKWESFDLADKIKLPAYFAAHGLRIVSSNKTGISAPLRGLTDELVKEVGSFRRPLAIFNELASESLESLVSPQIEESCSQDSDFLRLMKLFVDHNLVRLTGDRKLQFSSEDSRYYINGGWLEEHVFGILQGLRSQIRTIQDLARNVRLEWGTGKDRVENEIDVAFLADNRLYVIECKTSKVVAGKRRRSPAPELLYKLDTLRDYIGGTHSRAMLISYHCFTRGTRLRADKFHIEICDGVELFNIDNRLRNWIRK
jgi:hypothetical protein